MGAANYLLRSLVVNGYAYILLPCLTCLIDVKPSFFDGELSEVSSVNGLYQHHSLYSSPLFVTQSPVQL